MEVDFIIAISRMKNVNYRKFFSQKTNAYIMRKIDMYCNLLYEESVLDGFNTDTVNDCNLLNEEGLLKWNTRKH
jgi:hypothetical protein